MELVFAGSTQSRETWDALHVVSEHPKLPNSGKPNWHFQHNFCTDCEAALFICKHNPYGVFSENRVSARLASSLAVIEPEAVVVQPFDIVSKEVEKEDSNSSVKESFETSAPTRVPGTRGRVRTTRLALDESEHAEVLRKYNEGSGAVVLAKEYNINPMVMSAFLKASGCVVKRGGGVAHIKAIEARAAKRSTKVVPKVTPELVASWVRRYPAEKIGVFVAESGIAQPLISAALKAAGVEVRKGKPAKVVALTEAA